MPQRPLAVALISGGLDSCVAAALAAREHRLALLHASYGQRTQARELRAFGELADHFRAESRLAVDIGYMRQIGGSSLIDPSMSMPLDDRAAADVPSTYVPFRNAHLLGIAVAWAEVLDAGAVYIGVHQADSAYPDCSAEFIDAFNRAVALGTRPSSSVQIAAPLVGMDKAEIIAQGLAVGAPLALTWSCYCNERVACGRCHSCRLRRQGFRDAGHEDPLEYAAGGGGDGQDA